MVELTNQNINILYTKLYNKLANISYWSSANELLINVRKTKSMLISTKKSIHNNNTVLLNNKTLKWLILLNSWE